MSHEIEYFTYKDPVNKKQIEGDLDDYVSHRTYLEGGGGLPSYIRWLDVTLDSYDEARDYVESRAVNSYDCIAVKFLEYPAGKSTQAMEKMRERLRALVQERRDFEARTHIKDTHTSNYLGCQNCGSRINREYIRNDDLCPVCRASMKSPTTINRLASFDSRIQDLQDKLEKAEYEQSHKGKPTLKWLVRIEYHM